MTTKEKDVPTETKSDLVSSREERRRVRETKRQLRLLTDAVLIFVRAIDMAVESRKDIPDDVGRWLAKNVHALEFTNDAARYFGLGIDYRKDDKAKAVQTALARQKEGRG